MLPGLGRPLSHVTALGTLVLGVLGFCLETRAFCGTPKRYSSATQRTTGALSM